MESLAHELRQSAALFLAGAKRCEIERAESDQAPSGHQACARLLLSLVTRSRAMTSLWMNPTVDAAAERPAAATAGLRMAAGTPARAEVLTQWNRNLEAGPARGLSKVARATGHTSGYGGPSFTTGDARGGTRHLPADLDMDPEEEDLQGDAPVAMDDAGSWGTAQSDVEEDAAVVDLRSFHHGQEPQPPPAKGPRSKRPSETCSHSCPATHAAKGAHPTARKAQPAAHKSDADTPAMPERVARRMAHEEGLELPASSNATGFKGVYRTAHAKAKPFRAQVTAGRRSKLIGYYSSAAEAALAHARLGPDARVAAAAEAAEAAGAVGAAGAAGAAGVSEAVGPVAPRRQASACTEDAAAALLQLISGTGSADLAPEPSAGAPSASACTALFNMRRPDTYASTAPAPAVKAAPPRRAKAATASPADAAGRGTSGMRKWTAAETELLRELVEEHTDAGGYPRWASIAQGLPGRNAQESRCRWQRVRNSDRQSSAKRGGGERSEAAGVKRARGAGGLAAAAEEEEGASRAEAEAEAEAEQNARALGALGETLKLKGHLVARSSRHAPPPCTRSPSSVTDVSYLQPATPA